MPPDYTDLPVPDQNKQTTETNENKIKELVTKNENENVQMNNELVILEVKTRNGVQRRYEECLLLH